MKDQNTPTNTLEEDLNDIVHDVLGETFCRDCEHPRCLGKVEMYKRAITAWKDEHVSEAVNKALFKQAKRITQGGRGGTEIFVENTPLNNYIRQFETPNQVTLKDIVEGTPEAREGVKRALEASAQDQQDVVDKAHDSINIK